MQIGYMINNNLILFIVFSFTIVWGFAFNLKKKGKCKLHVNLSVMPSTEALPGGGKSHVACLNFKISCVGVSQNLMSPLEIERNPLSLLEFYRRRVEVHCK